MIVPELGLFDAFFPFLLLLTAGAFWSVHGLRPELRSSFWFATAFLFGALAFGVEFFGFMLPDFAQAFLGVACYCAMASCFVFGLVSRASRPPPFVIVSAIAVICTFAVAVFAMLNVHVLVRVCVAQLSAAIMLLIGVVQARQRFDTVTDKAVLAIVWCTLALLMVQPLIVGYFVGLPATAQAYDTSALFLTMGFMTTVSSVLSAGLLVREAVLLIVSDLKALADRDELTGILNRRGFDAAISGLIRRVELSDKRLAILAIDIDFFKQINDTHGHGFGDTVIQSVGQMLRAHRGETGLAARIGGEEFVLALEVASLEEACAMAELLRERWARQTFYANDKDIRSTASFGVSLHKDDDPILNTMRRADEALYQSKQMGRNRVSSEEDLKRSARDRNPVANERSGSDDYRAALKFSG
jgi:diguanylate cyclase (GGDEF)-like protein